MGVLMNIILGIVGAFVLSLDPAVLTGLGSSASASVSGIPHHRLRGACLLIFIARLSGASTGPHE